MPICLWKASSCCSGSTARTRLPPRRHPPPRRRPRRRRLPRAPASQRLALRAVQIFGRPCPARRLPVPDRRPRPRTEQTVGASGVEVCRPQAQLALTPRGPVQIQFLFDQPGPSSPTPGRCTPYRCRGHGILPTPPAGHRPPSRTIRPNPPPCCSRPGRPRRPRTGRTSAPPSNPSRTPAAPFPVRARRGLEGHGPAVLVPVALVDRQPAHRVCTTAPAAVHWETDSTSQDPTSAFICALPSSMTDVAIAATHSKEPTNSRRSRLCKG